MENPCQCQYQLLTEEERKEAIAITNSRIKIYDSTNRVVFLSFIGESFVGFGSSIGLPISRGFNVFCFCGIDNIRTDLASDLKISRPPLCTLREIPCKLDKTQAFIIRPHGHPPSCSDSNMPTLKTLSLLTLYLANYTYSGLENLEKQKKVPTWIRRNFPECNSVRGVLHWNDFVQVYIPYSLPYAPSCNDEPNHMIIFK